MHENRYKSRKPKDVSPWCDKCHMYPKKGCNAHHKQQKKHEKKLGIRIEDWNNGQY